MKVYELMNELASLPSGAEVSCFSSLTVNELESGIIMDDGDKNDILYEVKKPLDCVDSDNSRVYLCF